MSASKDDIIVLPNVHLRQRSSKVGIINEKIVQLIKDMESAVIDWDKSRPHEVTVALAAIQIDQPYRVVIVRDDFDHNSPAKYSTLINPEIIKYEGSVTHDYEGCLSIKHLYGYVPRYERVRIKAKDKDGKEIRYKADGFLARVLQHEIDHLNGIVFVDHIKDDPDAFFKLTDSGKLEPINYEKDILKSSILWQ